MLSLLDPRGKGRLSLSVADRGDQVAGLMVRDPEGRPRLVGAVGATSFFKLLDDKGTEVFRAPVPSP